MSNYDLADFGIRSVCPSDKILYDDKNLPSVMVKIPKFSWADVDIGDSTDPFPAFVVGDKTLDAIYVSKYENIIYNVRLYSLPKRQPAMGWAFEDGQAYATNKGYGWHEITRLEWMAIALWCKKNGFYPSGNNYYGKDYLETARKAIPATYTSQGQDSEGNAVVTPAVVKTGTGPLSWSHTGEPDGIWDLNGNLNEWTTGVRLVYGELQVMTLDGETFDNACADPERCDLDSEWWRAIDGTTGELIEPNGEGTTENSLKFCYDSTLLTYGWYTADASTMGMYGVTFNEILVGDNVCDEAIHILQALGMYTTGDSEADRVNLYCNLKETLILAGGFYPQVNIAGIFNQYSCMSRSSIISINALRAVYCDLS